MAWAAQMKLTTREQPGTGSGVPEGMSPPKRRHHGRGAGAGPGQACASHRQREDNSRPFPRERRSTTGGSVAVPLAGRQRDATSWGAACSPLLAFVLEFAAGPPQKKLAGRVAEWRILAPRLEEQPVALCQLAPRTDSHRTSQPQRRSGTQQRAHEPAR